MKLFCRFKKGEFSSDFNACSAIYISKCKPISMLLKDLISLDQQVHSLFGEVKAESDMFGGVLPGLIYNTFVTPCGKPNNYLLGGLA